MTNAQIYLAIGLPIVAVLASLTVSLVQISGIREDVRALRTEFRTTLDLIVGKLAEFDTRLAVLEERSKH